MMRRPRAVLTDIEGTTTRIAYVRDVLFPYARAHLPEFLHDHAARPDVAALIAGVARDAPERPPLETLLAWMDADAKITALKTLQGLIWHGGYLAGDLQGELYPDVAPALRRWHIAGVRLEVYSSGSVAAQRLLFGHSQDGNLALLFDRFHDTAVGPKRDAASYAGIGADVAIAAEDWLFLSDMEPELDAARTAGMSTCQLVRPADGTEASARHDHAATFDAVENLWR